MTDDARDVSERHRFELVVEGVTAFAEYRFFTGGIEFYHTIVPEALGGKGVGSRLVKSVLDQVRARGLKVNPTCPFFDAYIKKHSEYQDLVVV
ncbi:MAG: GNAT family N-acetyltransferase [Pseudomonadota bacterium]